MNYKQAMKWYKKKPKCIRRNKNAINLFVYSGYQNQKLIKKENENLKES